MNPELQASLDGERRSGFIMRGWDFTSSEVETALNNHLMLNPAFELGTNACPWNCSFCFTEDPSNPDGAKRRRRDEMSLERRLELIREAAQLGARAINVVGAGEPTIDPDFWEIIETINAAGVIPIVYTEGALRLRDYSFSRRLFELGATVVLKMNSKDNAAYQDAVVRGGASKKSLPLGSYTVARNEAMRVLLELGFAGSNPTRLAFDTIITTKNVEEIESLHRFARQNNIFTLLVNYLPSGRSQQGAADALGWADQKALFSRLAQIDAAEFGMRHPDAFPYGGGVACTIRGLGLYVKINGTVFDCPGEGERLGSVLESPLSELWARTAHIRSSFDGGCMPRMRAFLQSRRKQTSAT